MVGLGQCSQAPDASQPPHPGPLRGTGACHSATLSGKSAPASLSWNIPPQVRAGATASQEAGVGPGRSCPADLRCSWLLPSPFFFFLKMCLVLSVSPQRFSGQKPVLSLPTAERRLPTQSQLWPAPWSSDLAGLLLGALSRV